ncbi:MAG: hypothetical protein WC003_12345 [Terrimicrobiaceae bacterium]
MNAFERKEEIHEALTTLGKQMALAYAGDVQLLCCGGSGLCVLEILSRSTKDVDALAFIVDGHTLKSIEAFSPEMNLAILKTAQIHGLEEDWFNAEATILLKHGLPEGILERSTQHARQYGPCLRVQFIGRADQVALKLYAAMDPAKGRRHEEDLVAMDPTKEEIKHGLNWLLSWPSNEAFKKRLAFLVEGLGFGELL